MIFSTSVLSSSSCFLPPNSLKWTILQATFACFESENFKFSVKASWWCSQILIWLCTFRLLQEEAKNFITLENLDQRIEEALDNPKNYNFAIDKKGRIVKQTVLQWNAGPAGARLSRRINEDRRTSVIGHIFIHNSEILNPFWSSLKWLLLMVSCHVFDDASLAWWKPTCHQKSVSLTIFPSQRHAAFIFHASALHSSLFRRFTSPQHVILIITVFSWYVCKVN